MGDTIQRKRLRTRGTTRFQVVGLDTDRELIRSLAKRLAADTPDAARVRAAIRRALSDQPPTSGRILSALRRSPMVGAELNLERPPVAGRKLDG